MYKFMSNKALVGTGLIIIVIALVISLGGLIKSKAPLPTPKRIGVIGYYPIMDATFEGFKDGMAELGWVEGDDVVYFYEKSGDFAEIHEIAKGFIAKDVDLLFALVLSPAVITQEEVEAAGRTDIPIVFTNTNDPDKIGLIENFKSSGNNVTGVATDFSHVTAKKLEFLQRIDPSVKKIGVFTASFSEQAADYRLMLEILREEAPRFGMSLVEYHIESPPGPASLAEIETVIGKIKPGDFDAFFQLPGPISNIPPNLKLFVDLSKRLQVPSIFLAPQQVTVDGGLFTYGHTMYDVGVQAAPYADKVLKGTNPSDIPIEFQKKNNLVINLQTANEIGISIPQSLLQIADEIVE